MGNSRVRRFRSRASLMLALAIALMLILTGCDAIQRGYPMAVFRPESPQSGQITTLAILLLIIGGIAFVFVEGWLIVGAFRFRNRPEEQAVQTHGNLPLETGWTVATALVVFAVLALTVYTMWGDEFALSRSPDAALPQAGAFPNDVQVMRVVGNQFWWAFEYPREGMVTGNEIDVPVGRTVKAQLEAKDVIHSFWVPRLNGKTDTIPGRTNYTEFVAIQPGTYIGICGEYLRHPARAHGLQGCGRADPRFQQLGRGSSRPQRHSRRRPAAGRTAALPGNCAQCHTVRGTPAQGKIGPGSHPLRQPDNPRRGHATRTRRRTWPAGSTTHRK